MDQSLSISLTLEGGLPNTYVCVQDNYYSPAQVFNAPLEFIDIEKLVASLKSSGDYWIVTASPDNPRFQIESAIFVRHNTNKIIWELVYEHYEPFLNIELEPDADEFDENIISFVFDPFQYASALYQASLISQQLIPTTFKLTETPDDAEEHPFAGLQKHSPRLNILWQKYGTPQRLVENGTPVKTSDFLAEEAEKQWLQDIIDTLDAAHNDNVMSNLDAYLDSLPNSVLTQLEHNSEPLQQALVKRWEMLVNSLTEEEAEALENDQTLQRFPDSLKLRLMREFIDGNPSVLLGNTPENNGSDGEKVVDLQNWKRGKKR